MVPDNSHVLFAVATSESSPSSLLASKRQSRGATVAGTAPFTRSLTAALYTDSPLTALAEGLGSQIGADACVFVGRHLETEAVTLVLWQAQFRPQVWQVGAGLPTLAATAESAQLALRLIRETPQMANNEWRQSLRQLLEEEEDCWLTRMRSHQLVPIKATAQTEGLIILMAQGNRFRRPIPAALAEELSSLVALAFHQHHLHQQAHHSIEQRRCLNQLKDDFLSTLSHELRTPLTSMMLAIRMLRRPDLTPDRKAMYLDILEQQCLRETSLVNDLLALQTLESGSTPASLLSLNLNHFLRSLLATQQESFGSANLTLQLDLPQRWVTLETEPDHLARICLELLTNARKYAQPGTTVRIAVESDSAEPGFVVIKLLSEGAGIEPEELPHIFEKFRRGQGVTQRAIPGTGTGLALVKGLVQQMQGQISVTSQPNSQKNLWQTCFTLCLPQHGTQTVGAG
ncbi:MAG TPA: HAMP domain-containing sensor histidine kinase [Trichocoleus sp.]